MFRRIVRSEAIKDSERAIEEIKSSEYILGKRSRS